jgi:KTSC domain
VSNPGGSGGPGKVPGVSRSPHSTRKSSGRATASNVAEMLFPCGLLDDLIDNIDRSNQLPHPYGRCYVAAQAGGNCRSWLGLSALAATVLAALLSVSARSETADVKYRGLVDLKRFICTDTKSSFVNRVCYDKSSAYMLILLNRTWYHYCEIDQATVSAPVNADSVGHFYNVNIKGTGLDGPFDCRTHNVPRY